MKWPHFYRAYFKGIYNRLPLIMSYLLDIDLALWRLLLPWEVKFNKSWNTFFSIEVWIHIHNIIQTFNAIIYRFANWQPRGHGCGIFTSPKQYLMKVTLNSSHRLYDIMNMKPYFYCKKAVPWFIEFYFPRQKKAS